MDDTDNSMVTVRDALEYASGALREEGIDTPMLDARLLLARAMGRDMLWLVTHENTCLTDTEAARFNRSMTERLAHRPVAYITGVKEFYGRSFRVTEGVLIPRPDTETAVEAVLEYADRYAGQVRILDLCCGSGAIGLSVAASLPRCYVTLSDISRTAIDVTVQNASLLGTDNCEIIQSDLFEDLPPMSYDIIVSNPPYVSGDEMGTLSAEIQLWEPREALYGGVDGLSFYRQIISEAPGMFRNRGTLIMEIGFDQARDVEKLLKDAGYEDISFKNDLAGIPRVVCAGHSGASRGELL
ncbi:MAG: peptide chain release factor N(5)-glutamine methyltransferase [Eubacteriaceae bacterium]|nr:peptide chain release factor N(5)-glutamine methyltransferase [Eubacteriaceae bacterium]